MASKIKDITHFGDIFHYFVTVQALETLQNILLVSITIQNFAKSLDILTLACKIKALNSHILEPEEGLLGSVGF